MKQAHDSTQVTVIKTTPSIVRALSKGNGCRRHGAEEEHSSAWSLREDTAFGLGHEIFSQ